MLASAIEEASWKSFGDHSGMSGPRPITAAQFAQPALEVTVEDYEGPIRHPPRLRYRLRRLCW